MDTKRMRDPVRERFEAEFSRQFPIIFSAAKAGESKAHGDMSVAWWGWKAALESLVIELPEACEYAEQDGDYAKGHRIGKRDVVAAIEAQGLKVRS